MTPIGPTAVEADVEDVHETISRIQVTGPVAVSMRPLRRDDRERENTFVNSLSQRSRYLRLISAVKTLPPSLLEQFMDLDYHRRMALVATTTQGGVEEFVGIARYAAVRDSTTAEIGVTVADAWQRRGIARALVARLLRFAKSCGFERMEGFVLPENEPMLALAREFGFSVHYSADEQLMRIAYELSS